MSKKKNKKTDASQDKQHFSMLGFFRRYEKTFLLVLLAPALLSMGVTGVMLSVFRDRGDQTVGHLYGQAITQKQFEDVASLYRRVNPGADDNSAWQFFALLREAERAGIEVSDREVGDQIRSNFRWEILQYVARKEVQARGVDINTEEGQRLFNQVMFQKLNEVEFDEKIYREILEKQQGIGVAAYEQQRRRSAKVSRLLDTLREVATVSPDEVWKAFQEKNHKRVVEYVSLAAKDYQPELDAKDESSPHFIKSEQLDAFYTDAAGKGFYDEPRRVDLDYLAFSFNAARNDLDPQYAQLEDEDVEDYYQQHPSACVAAIGTDVPFAQLSDQDVMQVRELLMGEMALGRVDQVMNRVADLVQEANSSGQLADLGAIREQVQKELKTDGLVLGSTGPVEEDEACTHDEITGWATRRWFRAINDQKQTSDVLAGDKAWYVLRSNDIRDARRLTREAVADQLRQDYAQGTRAEQKAWYDQHKHDKYMQPPAFAVDVAYTQDSDFDGDHDAAKQALQKGLALATGGSWKKGFSWHKWQETPELKHIQTESIDRIDRAALDEHPLLANVASDISLKGLQELSSKVAETKDGKGWVVFRKTRNHPQELQPFKDVRDKVAADIALQRGMDRAEAAAADLLDQLANKTGEALTEKLEQLGLKTARTAPLARGDTACEGFPDAASLVNLAFADDTEVDGPFAKTWRDPDGTRVLLVRVAEKIDAPGDKYEAAFPTLRSDLLKKVRGQYASEQSQRILLQAKGITPEHVAYATKLRDGPQGQTQVTLRQIFLPPDREIIDTWLSDKALERIKQARKDLDDGKSWGYVVSNYSEDENTSSLRGALPAVGYSDLIESHGVDFVEEIFKLPLKQVSQPLKSKQGWHLVQKWQQLDDGKVEFRHVLVRTDPKLRHLPEEIQQKAEDKARKAMEAALERLKQGEPFVTVAEDVGDLNEPLSRGQRFDCDYTTAFERASLAQVLDWEPAEGSPEANDPMWMPEPVQVGDEWHWFACDRDRADQTALDQGSARRDRAVYHIVTKNKADMDAVRQEMTDWLKEKVDADGRPGFPVILRQFRKLAQEHSTAPDAAKGGAFGMVRLSDDVRPYGNAFLEKVSQKDDGSPVTPGYRTGVFQGDAGFHIVEVLDVKTQQADSRDHFLEIARVLLEGTSWD